MKGEILKIQSESWLTKSMMTIIISEIDFGIMNFQNANCAGILDRIEISINYYKYFINLG